MCLFYFRVGVGILRGGGKLVGSWELVLENKKCVVGCVFLGSSVFEWNIV